VYRPQPGLILRHTAAALGGIEGTGFVAIFAAATHRLEAGNQPLRLEAEVVPGQNQEHDEDDGATPRHPRQGSTGTRIEQIGRRPRTGNRLGSGRRPEDSDRARVAVQERLAVHRTDLPVAKKTADGD